MPFDEHTGLAAMTDSTRVDMRQVAGVLAAESRRRLWTAIVQASADPGSRIEFDDLSSQERRDLNALQQAGLVRVENGIASEVPDAFRGALTDPSNAEAGPEKFFVRGVLEKLPRRAYDRLEVLEYIAVQMFPTQAKTMSEHGVTS